MILDPIYTLLILGVFGFLIGLLLLSNGLLIYYLHKLYKRLARER